MRVMRFFGLIAMCACLYGCRAGACAKSAIGNEIEFTYKNSLSGTQQQAAGYVPSGSDSSSRPLLVVAHYAGGNKFVARDMGYYKECEERGWLCVCPSLHGKRMVDRGAFGSIESQRDIMDAVAYMRSRYRVDSTRIFIAGRSMGGMTAQLMAAKYPGTFAAAVAGQGISDLAGWLKADTAFKGYIENFACGPLTTSTAFEYARRSSVQYAPNLQYVPLILWHGTADAIVPPSQTATLFDAVSRYSPYQKPVEWIVGGSHGAGGMPVEWECEQLSRQQLVSEPKYEVPGRFYRNLHFVVDEDMEYLWLRVSLDNAMKFGKIQASLRNDSLVLDCENVKNVAVISERIGKGCFPRFYLVRSSTPMNVSFERNGKSLFGKSISSTTSGEVTGF